MVNGFAMLLCARVSDMWVTGVAVFHDWGTPDLFDLPLLEEAMASSKRQKGPGRNDVGSWQS